MNNNYYDVVIIGAGSAGLYLAHNLRSHFSNIIILETKQYVGGRTRMFEFYDHLVPGGAYGINPSKDTYITALIQSLNIPINSHSGSMNYDHIKYVDIMAIMDQMKEKLTPENSHWNTKRFMTTYLGATKYNDFVIAAGYRDFESQCITDTLTHYSMDDNAGVHSFAGIPWNTVWETVAQDLHIEYNVHVQNIIANNNNSYGVVAYNKIFYGTKIILATDILSVKSLLPMCDIYHSIHPQPFIRIYVLFNNEGYNILQSYVKGRTLVATPLQSIYQVKDGIYHVAYSDNANAELLSDYIVNNEQNKRILETMVAEALSCPSLDGMIMDIMGFYKYPGTHYYTCGQKLASNLEEALANRMSFIHEAQRPLPNIWVVGEAVGLRQGWVENALGSVEAVLSDIINSI